MFKKFTDTLSGTLDTVKSYGSSMGIGQSGQNQTDGRTANTASSTGGKLSLNLPSLGNGSASAPVTTQNSPDPNQKASLASNTLLGIQNTLVKITGRGESTNAMVAASHQKTNRGPMLGRAVETNETRITELHTLNDDEKVSGYHDITSYEQYKKVSDTGQMRQLESTADYSQPASKNMNGKTPPRLVRSNTDEIIDQEFEAAKGNLDDVLDMAEYVDELTPVATKDEPEEEKKPKKKKNKHLARCIRCIQDNRVKGGCVDPEEMVDNAEEHAVLKKVLNIMFLVVGIMLFAAVFAVIIYTTYGPQPEIPTTTTTTTTPNPNNTLPYFAYTTPVTIMEDSEDILRDVTPDGTEEAEFIIKNLRIMSGSADTW